MAPAPPCSSDFLPFDPGAAPLIRWLASWTSAILLGLIVVAPLAALVARASLDRGPDGAIRASIFPGAITVLDPFVGACVRNSALMALAVALTSLLVGIGLGRALGDWRFPLRGLVVAMLAVAAATPPAVLALGLAILVNGQGELAWRGWFDRVGGVDRLAPLDWGWLGWFWAAVAQGSALAALAFLSAHDRLDPAWRDAAKLAGGSRNRVWWRLNWPLLRPALAQAIGLVFAATLADPGAPLILGLRRTLGYQVVVAGLGPEPFPRIAVLGLIILLLVAIVRLVLFVWSGADRLSRVGLPLQSANSRPSPPASLRRTLGAWLFAGAWSVLLAAPVLAIVAGLGLARPFSSGGINEVARRLSDSFVVDLAVRSALLGIAMMILAAIARRVVRGLEVAAGSASTDRFERFARLGAAAPIIAGIVALCVPGLVEMIAASFGERSAALSRLADWLGGGRASFPLLACGVWLAMAPVWLGSRARRVDSIGAGDPRFAAALLAGAGHGRARRLALGASWPARRRSALLIATLAATNIAPAVLFVSSARDSTVGPALLFLHERPGDGLATASALALAVFAFNAAVALTCRPSGLEGASSIQAR